VAPPSVTRKRRSVLDFSRGQTGDVATGDNAGGNITHGADATEVLAFLRSYVFEADQKRETAIKDLARELVYTRGDMGILSDAVRAVRDQVDDLVNAAEADARQRPARQAELDRQLTIARRWLAGLTIALLVALAVVAVLVLDRYVFVSVARAWFDVALAVVSARVR